MGFQVMSTLSQYGVTLYHVFLFLSMVSRFFVSVLDFFRDFSKNSPK